MVKKSIFIRKQIVISMNFVESLIICCLKVRPLWPLRNSVLSLYFVWNASSNCPKHDFHHIYFLHSEWIMMNIMVISFHSVLFTVYKSSMTWYRRKNENKNYCHNCLFYVRRQQPTGQNYTTMFSTLNYNGHSYHYVVVYRHSSLFLEAPTPRLMKNNIANIIVMSFLYRHFRFSSARWEWMWILHTTILNTTRTRGLCLHIWNQIAC